MTNNVTAIDENILVVPENINDQDFEKFAKAIGQDDFSQADRIPRLSIEQSTDDNEGNTIPRGKYRLWVDNSTYYINNPTVRLFLRMFSYSVYDQSENRFSNRTILKPSLKDAFPDTAGGLKCGKLGREEIDSLGDNSIEKALQKSIRCAQTIYGVIESGKAYKVDSPKKTVDMKGTPFMWTVRGASFIPVSDFIKGLTDHKKIMLKTSVKLATERMQRGSVTYYQAKVTETGEPHFGDEDINILSSFADDVNKYNAYVLQEHKDAKKLLDVQDELDVETELAVGA